MQARAIAILRRARATRAKADAHISPLLVHCSAGVGRTGTLILIDTAINMSRSQPRIDLLSTLGRLREDRMALVQTAGQFQFAHAACAEVLKARHSTAVAAVPASRGTLTRRLQAAGAAVPAIVSERASMIEVVPEAEADRGGNPDEYEDVSRLGSLLRTASLGYLPDPPATTW